MTLYEPYTGNELTSWQFCLATARQGQAEKARNLRQEVNLFPVYVNVKCSNLGSQITKSGSHAAPPSSR